MDRVSFLESIRGSARCPVGGVGGEGRIWPQPSSALVLSCLVLSFPFRNIFPCLSERKRKEEKKRKERMKKRKNEEKKE